jgi:hypothetical protein
MENSTPVTTHKNDHGVAWSQPFEGYQYPLTVAWKIPGTAWKRQVVRSQRAMSRLMARLIDEGAEIRTSDGGN